jgi:hypothetical protein
MGFFDSSTTVSNQTATGTIAPNAPGGAILGGSGAGSTSASVGYSPGNIQGQGSYNVSSGGIIDQSLNFLSSFTDTSTHYANQTAPTVNVGSPGASGASGILGTDSGGSILGLTWQAWAFLAGAVFLLTYFLRKH